MALAAETATKGTNLPKIGGIRLARAFNPRAVPGTKQVKPGFTNYQPRQSILGPEVKTESSREGRRKLGKERN